MRLLQIYKCCRNVLRKQRLDQDLELEIRSYVDLTAEEKMRAGLSRDEALMQARREVGGLEQVKESVRDVRVGASMDRLLQDFRYGVRVLRKNPGFAAVAVVTLALGIGTTTAIFSLVDAVMFKPLPFPTADRLVRVQSVIIGQSQGGVASYPDFLDWRARNKVFAGMGAFRTNDFTLAGRGEAMHLQGGVVSAQLFSLLGVSPALGRSFLQKEDRPAATNGTDPVIVSYGLWRREFGGNTSILGRTIQLSGQAFTVVGIMPEGFQFPIQAESVELWTTIAVDAQGGANAMTEQRGAHYLDVLALLKPGIRLQQAQAEMAAITSILTKQHPENKPRTVKVIPEIQGLIGPVRTPLLILLGAVACVLLIVCVNVANLLLARGTRRSKEMAIRAALGAGRGRAIRQLLTESLTLSLLGGCSGLLLAVWTAKLLVRLMPTQVPRLNGVGIDGRLLIFAFLISVACGVLFGLAPALQVSKINLTESLKESWWGARGDSRRHNRVRATLVVSEITLAVVLLLGASLLIQSFANLMRVDPGFNPHHVLTFQLDAPTAQGGPAPPTFFREVVSRVSLIPGVTSASAATSLPLTGDDMRVSIEVEEQPTPMGSRAAAEFRAVEPGYLRTVGIPVIRGRDFNAYDRASSTPVVVVNRTLARRFFFNQNPIGKHIRPGIGNGYGPGEPPMREIVGVIGDVKETDLGAEGIPAVYGPLSQSPFSTMFIVVRTASDPQSIVAAVRHQVSGIDKNVPLYHLQTLDQYFAQALLLPRLVTILLAGFAALALLLACLGVYGVVSYITVQRTREIGIRMALGSGKSDVLGAIVAEGLRPTLLGLAIGIGISLRLTRVLSSLLFGLKSTDPLTFAVVSLVLISVALLACYVPARRSANLDPLLALRHE